MFKYPEDRTPITIILAITFVDICVFFLTENFWFFLVYWLMMMVPKGNICAWNHHHQHLNTFHSKAMNRVMEFFYALHTGATTHLWVLHHVLGHHHNYLDQSKDESRWKRKDGSTMGELEYTFNIAITSYYRGYQVGKTNPKLQKEFLFFALLTFTIVALLVAYKPVAGIFIFILPMICGLLFTSWATYEHHAGLDTDNDFEASYNNLSPFYNLVTGNLGYHTAHHYKQGAHWSKLPELHAKIKDKIPDNLIRRSVVT